MMQAGELAGWIAPVATMIAAMMTAANLGARITGWGFAVFTIGSVAWSVVGVTSGQTNLIVANGFLTLINAVGIWRWLGRQARYDKGGTRAAEESERPQVETLFAAGAIGGAKVVDRAGATVGTVVDAMLSCETHRIEYLVVSAGGVGGIGETLHAIDPDRIRFNRDRLRFDGSVEEAQALPEIAADDWPARLPQRH